MKKTLLKLSVVLYCLLSFAITGCEEALSTPESPNKELETPTDLTYSNVTNVREYGLVTSNAPSINSDGIVPTFEIVSISDATGALLDESYMADVDILNATVDSVWRYEKEGDVVIDSMLLIGDSYSKAGIITINGGNQFGIGEYFFTVKTTLNKGSNSVSEIFENIFKLKVDPLLANALVYSPLAQNLIVGGSAATTEPFMPTGNSDVRFELATYEDILDIDGVTGSISLKSSYSFSEIDTIYPSVNIVSNISEEIVQFGGSDFLTLVISDTPVDLPKQTIKFFYPTMQDINTAFGLKVDVQTAGAVTAAKTWERTSAAGLAASERPSSVVGNKSIWTNMVIGGKGIPHESTVIINSQNLYNYSKGFELSSTFYLMNKYVEYMNDGATPTKLNVYVSTDYTGDLKDATWELVNSKLECLINKTEGTPIVGLPYPGDQKGADPEGEKNTKASADGKWVKCKLDLEEYKDAKNFTLIFKIESYFEGEILNKAPAKGRSGRYYISDVHFQAKEI